AEELVELARAKGLFLMEGMWTYINPIVRRMMELVREGAIGEVRMIQADFGFAGKFDPANRMRNPELGGGALLDLGVYPVSFAHLLLGDPSEIQARAHLTPEGTDAETGMLLGWESGATALLSCSITASLPITAVVSGTKGRIEFPRGFFAPLKCVLHVDGEDPVEITEPEPKGMRDEAAEVMRALRAGQLESPLVPLEGSLAVMRTLDRVRGLIGVRYPGEV
ncbi:Gfo/Idh/MocA family oxidoreductase, partial [Streptomyces pathocidini]|uniref:Gfo/Idh/MocA family protein n=1 Tax=Streptomyces pathocidini TaxID=1650571 RepID=UPI0033D1A163